MFPSLMNASADIWRSQAVGTNGRSQTAVLYEAVPCLLIPMDNHTAIEQKFSIGRAYNVYFNQGRDLQAADQLIIGDDTYSVKIVQPFNVPLAGYTLAMTEMDVS